MTSRWWLYQQERFPVIQYAVLAAALAASAVGYAASVRHFVGMSSISQFWVVLIVAFIVLVLFGLQLRIADEFKDYKEDARYQPTRPVPRGLVQLWELGVVAIAAALIQFALSLAIGGLLLLPLLLVWAYLGAMSQAFFVRCWLRSRFVAQLLLYGASLSLMAIYGLACDGVAVGNFLAIGTSPFVVMSFGCGLAIELSRKIRAPKQEETGIETYSAAWGYQRAAIVWVGIVWLIALSGLWAAIQIDFAAPAALVLIALLTLSLIVAWQFVYQPVVWAKRLEQISHLWLIAGLLSVGCIPLLMRGLA
jgi:4-hydroxybenzoate polyprenyltransferase